MPVGNVPVVSLVMDWVFDAGLTGEIALGEAGNGATGKARMWHGKFMTVLRQALCHVLLFLCMADSH
jgi:hypothetical protein